MPPSSMSVATCWRITASSAGTLRRASPRPAAIVEETYRTQCVEHAYLEAEAGTAWLDPGDVVRIRCGTQMIENFRFVARTLGVPPQ